MGVIENIERGLEKAVRGVFSAGSKHRLEPVDLASRLRAEMDNKAYAIAEGRTIAPNVFVIEFSETDFPRAQDWGQDLAEELCEVAIRHARAQGYTLRGAVRVSFTRDRTGELRPGEFVVTSGQERSGRHPQEASRDRRRPRPAAARPREDGTRTASSDQGQYRRRAPQAPDAGAPIPAEAAPAAAAAAAAGSLPTGSSRIAPRVPSSRRGAARAQAAAAEGRSGAGAVRHPEAAPRPQPVLDINGQRFTLRAPSVVLGRSSAADITVEDTGVSRRHLEILHQDGVYLAVDLGSTNGSTVDGERLRGRRELTDGSVITMGRTTIVFRLLTPRSGTAWPQS